MDNKRTGTLIAQRRKELHLTQKDVAENLHVSTQAVSKWERGLSFPDILLLEPLAKQLQLTVTEILAGERSAPPREELVQDSLHLSFSQLNPKIKKWRRRFFASAALLLSFLLVLGYFHLKAHTKLFPQRKTILSYLEPSATTNLLGNVLYDGTIGLYHVTYADGITGEELRLELWTSDGLMQSWPLASASNADPDHWPRQETIAFATDASYRQNDSSDFFHYGATLHHGTWQGTLDDVPYLSAGFGSNILMEDAVVHPEYGVIIACYYLDTAMSGRWTATPCLGAMEKPDVEPGQAVLLLRLLYEYDTP